MSILYYKGKRSIVVRAQDEKLILVVEDSDVLRKQLARILLKLGISTDTAQDGVAAVEKASTGAYDLILMDLAMPGMDGYHASRTIREIESAHSLPRSIIVAVTSFGTKEECLACGMDDYILKPVYAEHLRPILDRWLGSKLSHLPAARYSGTQLLHQTPP